MEVSFCCLMFLLGDDALPLRYNLLRPYFSSNLERVLWIFNYRHSKARQIIENTFGILAARFRVFRRPVLSCLEAVTNINKACVALYNHVMASKNVAETNSYCRNRFLDQDAWRNGEWREIVKDDSGLIPLSRNCSNSYSRDAKVVRDMFMITLICWQLNIVSVTMSK